jgi:hypothetical protein
MRDRVVELLMQAIPTKCGMPVHTYNDMPNRTVVEVIALLDAAAKLATMGEPISRDRYLNMTAAYTKSMQEAWNKYAKPDEVAVARFEAELKTSMSKLVPWQTIMEQIERAAA